MSILTVIMTVMFYSASAILLVGLGRKIYTYAKTPAPLKIPTTPAPVTQGGVVLRMASEVVLFNSLFKSNKWIWIFGWMFHMALFVVLARHLRYFTDPVWWWVEIIQPFGRYGAFAMLIGLLGLWARRIFVERIRYISAPSDHLMLALLLGITLTGIGMSFVSHTDIVAVKAFFMGLMRLDFQPFPADPILIAHITMVSLLMMVFPISKLLHAPGVFFSPTRNQVDNPREKRHLSPWAAELPNEPTKSS